jgi:hypothetical protein
MKKFQLSHWGIVGVMGALLAGIPLPSEAKWLTLHNDFFMYDLDGNPIRTRSGALRKFGDTYYWYGSANRFTDQTCYASKDLLHWTYKGVVLEAPSTNRVDVVYNETTQKYVMFLKTGASDGAELGIATSNTPDGKFTLVGNSQVFGHNIGDMSVYQDDDGQAYLAYVWDSIPGANSGGISQHALSRMSADYFTPLKRMWLWNRGSREANMVMKRRGLYYYLTSLTLWTESTATQYYTASNIEGPWTNQLVPMMTPGNTANNSWDTQCDFVFPFKGTKDTTFMYVGDRWEKPDPARLGDYVFLPIAFTPRDSVLVNYYQDWEVDPDQGIWRPIEDSRNLALGKTATASSSSGTNTPGKATVAATWRNYRDNKWVSNASDDEWIQVDLGSSVELNRVILKWDSSYAEAFKIQTSADAMAWNDVFSTTTGRARSVTDETFATTQARYVRMLGEKRGTTQGYSLYQFMVLKDSLPPVSNIRQTQSASSSQSYLNFHNSIIHYSVPTSNSIQLELWNSQGKRIANLDAGYRSAGPHQFSMPNSLPSGNYILRLKVGTREVETLKIKWARP